jgi:hypothetical protein
MKFVLGFDNGHRVLVLVTNQKSLLLPISLNLFSSCLISNCIWCLYFLDSPSGADEVSG